jgi:hypothetical protein
MFCEILSAAALSYSLSHVAGCSVHELWRPVLFFMLCRGADHGLELPTSRPNLL